MCLWVTGDPHEVVTFLNDVSQAVARLEDLTDEDLAQEKDVLAAELGQQGLGFDEGLAAYRWGASGLGLVDLGAPTLHSITRDEVVEWGRRWLTSGNAMLSFNGPVPEALDVSLPPGPEPQRSETMVPLSPTPSLIGSMKDGLALSLLTDQTTSPLLAAALADELKHELRHERRLIYSVDRWSVRVDEDQQACAFVLDPRLDDVEATAVAAVKLLRRLAAEGFSDRALAAVTSSCRTSLSYVDAAASGHLDEVVVDTLRGRTTTSLEEHLAAAEAVTSEQLSNLLAAAMPSVQVAVCDAIDLSTDDLTSLGLTVDPFRGWVDGAQTADSGKTYRSRRFGGDLPAGLKLTLGAERMTIAHGSDRMTVTYADLAVVGRHECGCFELLDRQGRVAKLDPDDWRQGADLASAFLERFDPGSVRTLPSH
ncbi:hypothetical protein [Aeromicrobium sp. Sec7.5]|uniref:hypothetical protein n=1 Tax=Aeromicrobium sp. Sec7.5 TaxID=3121276 RepID=UPI002FE4CC37